MKRYTIQLLAAIIIIVFPDMVGAGRFWDLPTPAPPHEYGDILLDRISTANGVKPVYFSHWRHRSKYTCRVCHWELDFSFRAGQTDITETDNRNGLYCGKCHDGRVAFGHTEENCLRCHTGEKSSNRQAFNELRSGLQKDKFGNGINWSASVRSQRIKPLYSIFHPEEQPLEFKKRLVLKAEWPYVPDAIFPHKAHIEWLDCGSCHPDIFKIKKKTTEHFLMKYILEEKFCGVCHLKVAFPMDNCRRCHPDFKGE